MKRLRWSAVVLGLVLATSWAGAAQASTYDEGTTTTTVGDTTTTTTVGATTTTTTVGATTTTTTVGATTTTATNPPAKEPQPCSPEDGVESVSGITADTAAEHPTASVQFTIKEGCIVQLALVSFVGLLDEPGDIVDIAPPDEQDSFFPPGDHSLTVALPDCSRFSVLLFGFPVLEESPLSLQSAEAQPFTFTKPSAGGVGTLAATSDEEPELSVLDAIEGETTNCPTRTTSNKVATTTIVEVTTPTEESLPFTGSNAMPILIAGLVLVAGGAAAVLASRARGRQAK